MREVLILEGIREKIRKFMEGRYGIDDLGKIILAADLILYILGSLIKSIFLCFLSLAVCMVFLYRVLSKQTYARSEENCKYLRYKKLWKLRGEYGKTSRIYICANCGKMIRVPKGKGKIQITCPNCSNKIIRYS